MSGQEAQHVEITILVHPEAVEGISDALFSIGAKGIVEERLPLHVRVTAYLSEAKEVDERLAAIRRRLAALEKEGLRLGPGTITHRTVSPQAWESLWKQHFKVWRVAPGLVIAPSWEKYRPEAGECAVTLDPGAAFGTGDHPTTRLCLRLLVGRLRPGDRVADVGCGSGILAITAAVLGAREVIATDSDPGAVSVARQNVRRNGVADVVKVFEGDLLSDHQGSFDLIVCNILAQEVMRLAGEARALLNPGGTFIGSGFEGSVATMVEDALAKAGLEMVSTVGEEGWTACVAVRPGPGR